MALACSLSAFKTDFSQALDSARELGFRHVDLICIPGWNHIVPAELADEFDSVAEQVEQLLSENNLEPVAMNCGLPATYMRDAETCEERDRQVDALARLAQRLGVQVASFYPGYKVEDRPWQDVLADSAESCREIVGAGEQHDVLFAIELHYDTPVQTLEQCHWLLEEVPELMVAYDPSHFAMQGIDLRNTAGLLDRSVHMHLRDAAPEQMCVPVGEGTVDFGWLVDAMGHRAYDGHWSIEYLPGAVDDVRAEVRKLKDLVQPMLG
jgi:sugar phosphate isomerase/epimerase